MSGRIDVHQHLVPPRYRAWLDELGLAPGGLQTPPWSEELALQSPTSATAFIRSAALDDQQRRVICFGNADRLLGLVPSSAR